MITFRYSSSGPGSVTITAVSGGLAAGSVAVRELSPDQVAVGRLHVRPGWRRQHVARHLMLLVLGAWAHAEIWLYAQPFSLCPGEPAGPSRLVLESFYASLGFISAEDASGRPAMLKPARIL